MLGSRSASRALARRAGTISGLATRRWALRALSAGAVTSIRVAALTVAPCAAALRGVRDYHVGSLLHFRNHFEPLVLWIEGGSGLRGHDRENLDALHVLLNIGAVHVADDRAAGDERRLKDALGKLRARGTPRREVATQTSNFDLNASRHRALI
jgi:hypothetical protein